eukprot:TRINITY_DN5353_c0_g1_i1.p1 TRINITY_DN5353_c0_g1~~TRINITY_DN5353_c0_g1_i1.p1  ORF type:complete len:160 (+),score=33.59 TRINITY_DN5353_c0_g1_i1:236-715(+)
MLDVRRKDVASTETKVENMYEGMKEALVASLDDLPDRKELSRVVAAKSQELARSMQRVRADVSAAQRGLTQVKTQLEAKKQTNREAGMEVKRCQDRLTRHKIPLNVDLEELIAEAKSQLGEKRDEFQLAQTAGQMYSKFNRLAKKKKVLPRMHSENERC